MEGAAEVPWAQEPTNGAVLNNVNPLHTYILIKHTYLKFGSVFSCYASMSLVLPPSYSFIDYLSV